MVIMRDDEYPIVRELIELAAGIGRTAGTVMSADVWAWVCGGWEPIGHAEMSGGVVRLALAAPGAALGTTITCPPEEIRAVRARYKRVGPASDGEGAPARGRKGWS